MIFVDTNAYMYAVGRPHPLREPARELFRRARAEGQRLFTSAEVLQELLHAYLPVGRRTTLVAAMQLARGQSEIVPLDEQDVALALDLEVQHPGLGARDLVHLSICLRREATGLHTFDRALAAAFAEQR